jgi:hypothetical protein
MVAPAHACTLQLDGLAGRDSFRSKLHCVTGKDVDAESHRSRSKPNLRICGEVGALAQQVEAALRQAERSSRATRVN